MFGLKMVLQKRFWQNRDPWHVLSCLDGRLDNHVWVKESVADTVSHIRIKGSIPQKEVE